MAFLQIARTILRHPDFSFAAFPDQNLEGKVDRDAWSRQHQPGPGLGITKDQQLGGAHLEVCFFSLSAVVDESLSLQRYFRDERPRR